MHSQPPPAIAEYNGVIVFQTKLIANNINNPLSKAKQTNQKPAAAAAATAAAPLPEAAPQQQ